MHDAEEFGRFLEAIRGTMSLRDAAEKSDLSHTYIRNLELGKSKKPSPETLSKLAKAYDYPYHKLMFKAGILDNVQYVFDFDNPGELRPMTEAELVAVQQENYELMQNDIEKILFDNNNISYKGVPLSLYDKQKIIDMLPILLRD